MVLTPAQIKPKSFESKWNSFFFLPRVDASHVYVRAWALGCFRSVMGSTQTFRRALTASVDSCAEIKSVPSVTKSCRVWRKVPESDAQSVGKTVQADTPDCRPENGSQQEGRGVVADVAVDTTCSRLTVEAGGGGGGGGGAWAEERGSGGVAVLCGSEE